MSPFARRMTVLLAAALSTVAVSGAALAQRDFGKVQIKRTEVANGVYVLEGVGGNIGVSAGENGVILIDDQIAPLHDKILFAVREISDQPIRFVINTHWHGDHTGGNALLAGRGAWIVAHDNVRTRLSTEQFSGLWNEKIPASEAAAWPAITFSENMDFHVNGQDIRVFHVENAHTDGDAIVHFANRDVIHMGDCFWNGFYPLIDVDAGGSLRGMVRAANDALLLVGGATKIVPGHGPVGNREDLRAFRDMLIEVERRVRPLVVAGGTADEIARARPLADLDAKWGGGFMKPDMFLKTVVADLSR